MGKILPIAIWPLLKQAAKGSLKDKVPKLSASLAYYTIFSLGPMMIVAIYLVDMFWGRQAIEGRLYGQIRELVGNKAAFQIQEIIKNASFSSTNNFTAAVGLITLVIGATTVFSEIQDSINSIWKLKAKAEKGWLKLILSRLVSFSLVISLGFLMLVSLIINTLVEAFMGMLEARFPETAVIVFYILNLLLTLFVIWILFAVIFKVLPDAVITWKDVAAGAFFTAVLFMVARFAISFYIGKSDIGSSYGAAGSLVVLLLWVYFSAIILYFGAEFTRFYALRYGSEIKPNKYAVMIQPVEIESNKKNLQENEADAERTAAELQKAKTMEDTQSKTERGPDSGP